MGFRLDTPYYPISGSGPENLFGAIMEMLLKSRLRLTEESSNQSLCDEDVNTYLGGLLVAYIDPHYLTAISAVVSKYDVDVHEAVGRAQDRVQTYWIYKVNADDLLVSLGIFHHLWGQAKGEMVRMQRYYATASDYQKRIYGKVTAVAEIQYKLSEVPQRYLRILSVVRRDYLRLVSHLGSVEMEEFCQKMEQFEGELPLRLKQDEMLDAYSACIKEPENVQLRQRLILLLEEVKKLDPSFQPDQILSRLPHR